MLQVDPYFINGQHRITVAVVGAGGNGSLIVTKLAQLSMALNHLDHPGFYVTLYDDDVVEPFNVGRQMFTKYDVGYAKSTRLIQKINASFGLDWDAKEMQISADNSDELSANIVISCVDTVVARQEILEAFYKKSSWGDTRKKYYLIDTGNGKDFGQVILSDHDKKLPNLFDLFPNIDLYDTIEEQGRGCSFQDKMNEQDLIVNHWVSIYTYHLLRDIMLNKQLDYHGVIFNCNKFVANKFEICHDQTQNAS